MQKKIVEISSARSALDTVRESEMLLIHFKVSINSSSGSILIGAGLKGYLKKTKRKIYFQIIFCLLKIAQKRMTAFIYMLRGCWSSKFQSTWW